MFIIFFDTTYVPLQGGGVREARVSKHCQRHNGPKLKVLNALGPLCNERHIAPNELLMSKIDG